MQATPFIFKGKFVILKKADTIKPVTAHQLSCIVMQKLFPL